MKDMIFDINKDTHLKQSSIESKTPGSKLLRSLHRIGGQKKKILVVEDSEINREILVEMLQDEFDVISAENGKDALALLNEQREQLSLILLDVYMPVCNGFEFLEQTQSDPYLSSIPVIVATGSEKRDDEEKCIRLGATDFITKPYNMETMLGRIHNVIRLRESISELAIIEFDRLTGLYMISAFMHHVSQLMDDKIESYDMAILSILDFSSINRMYGEKKGDEVLKFVADILKENLTDAMLARQGNNFFIFDNSNKKNVKTFLQDIHNEIELNAPVPNIRVRKGFYERIDISQPVSILCDRLKLAITFTETASTDGIYYYDSSMENKILEEKKLLMAFEKAIENQEFHVWIQPKVNMITGSIVAGEALTRWIDQEGKFISPGIFIPLFEREGQIMQLDEYIFRKVCSLQKKRKNKKEKMIPISVNLSRNSLFRKDIVNIYKQIAIEEGIELSMVPLEITESAATTEKQILHICNSFVDAGFVLQMDDFGTGYSSLSALATLPFSVIKLDKSLIDQIGQHKGNVIIKNIVDTAHELGMKVVAEGVEEISQVEYLALVDCDQIQGYYYSPPKDIEVFETLMEKDQPFAGQASIENANKGGIIRFSSADLNKYLRICKTMFNYVRILDDDCSSYCMANDDGTITQSREKCHEIWNRNERCSNCISKKVMQTKQTEHKFEVFEDEVFSIYSVYVEVDGRPRIIELLSTVGTGMLNGYKEKTTLLSLVQNENIELFMDVQLGTLNRRFFEQKRDKLKDISVLVMIDIDDFKNINDLYGHLTGDRVLKEVIKTIKGLIRGTDYLIRVGGDEFMLGFTGMKIQRLESKLYEIKTAVENIRMKDLIDIKPTISMGAAICHGYSKNAHNIADQALYEAKKVKNAVVIQMVEG